MKLGLCHSVVVCTYQGDGVHVLLPSIVSLIGDLAELVSLLFEKC